MVNSMVKVFTSLMMEIDLRDFSKITSNKVMVLTSVPMEMFIKDITKGI